MKIRILKKCRIRDHKDKKGEEGSHVTYSTVDMAPSIFRLARAQMIHVHNDMYIQIICMCLLCSVLLLHLREIKNFLLLAVLFYHSP